MSGISAMLGQDRRRQEDGCIAAFQKIEAHLLSDEGKDDGLHLGLCVHPFGDAGPHSRWNNCIDSRQSLAIAPNPSLPDPDRVSYT